MNALAILDLGLAGVSLTEAPLSGLWPAFAPAVLALLGGPMMDPFLLGLAFALVLGWTAVCNWMAIDVPWVGADRNLWFGISMGVGTLGLLMLWLLNINFAIFAFFFLFAGQTAAYVVYRNMIVPRHLRVLTPEWIRQQIKGRGESRLGAELTLKTKTDTPVDLKWMDGPSQIHDPPEDVDFRLGFDQGSILLFDAITRRATDIALTPANVVPVGDIYNVTLVIDGFAVNEKPVARQVAQYMILWIKKCAAMDLNEYRKPQKGKLSVMATKKRVDLLVNTQGSVAGEEIRVRLLDRTAIKRLGDLGMSNDLLEKFRTIVGLERGVFVTCGLPGSGVTTTQYALMREHDMFQSNVSSFEDPVLMDVENATQQEYKADGGRTSFAKALQTFFRAKDPDVLMIGRSDPETLQFAAQFSERKKIYIALEAASSIEGLGRVIKALGDGDIVNRSLIGVSCQKLIRVLCAECKVPYKPDPTALRKINVAPERVNELFRPPSQEETLAAGRGVCPKCQGTGYFGQTAAFELLVISDPIRDLILKGGNLREIQTEARKEKMLYLHEEILRKVIDGTTSVNELTRVMQTAQAGK